MSALRRPYRQLGAPASWPRARPNSIRVMCPTCGRSGFAGGTWADACLRIGHPFKCICGRVFSKRAAAMAHVSKTRSGTHALLDTDHQA